MMKKVRKARSKSPSKRLQFRSGRSAAGRDIMVAAPVSLSSYMQRVRQALSGDNYREFVDVVTELGRSAAATDSGEEDAATEKVISQIERAVSLLDGQPRLIDELRVFLPPQYHIDIQPDAVVIKVYETQGGHSVMVDTGHSRPVDGNSLQLLPPQSSSYPGRAATTLCQRLTPTRTGPGKRCAPVRERPLSSSVGQSVELGALDDTVGYVLEVKQALASQPEVYRQFVRIIQSCHEQLRTDHSDQLDVSSVRQIVTLLRTRPHLVLNFNHFLPDAYRIRMFDRSAYVIEYPDRAGGVASLTVAV